MAQIERYDKEYDEKYKKWREERLRKKAMRERAEKLALEEIKSESQPSLPKEPGQENKKVNAPPQDATQKVLLTIIYIIILLTLAYLIKTTFF